MKKRIIRVLWPMFFGMGLTIGFAQSNDLEIIKNRVLQSITANPENDSEIEKVIADFGMCFCDVLKCIRRFVQS